MESDPKQLKPLVYKLKHAGKKYYRLGLHAHDAAKNLARELRVKPEAIEILEGGKPQ